MEPGPDIWRRCSGCKSGIAYAAEYFVCSVSTCNRPRTGLVFCTVSCWETHLPVMNHREAWALDRKAPTREAWQREQQTASGGIMSTARPGPPVPKPTGRPGVLSALPKAASPLPRVAEPTAEELERDVLVVASKLKAYVRARSGMNTSDGVLAVLSEWMRWLADEAIRNAGRDGRKTMLERDVPPPRVRS